jgi:hypothetical protein
MKTLTDVQPNRPRLVTWQRLMDFAEDSADKLAGPLILLEEGFAGKTRIWRDTLILSGGELRLPETGSAARFLARDDHGVR